MNMGTFLQYDISIYAMLYLGMLFVLILRRKEIYSVSSKLILLIVGTNILILLFEVLTWMIDGLDGQVYFYLSYLFNSFLFVLVGLIVSLWMSYVDYIMYRRKERLVSRRYYLWVTFLTIFAVLINVFVPIIFEVNEANQYERGFFFDVYYFLFIILFVYSVVMTVYKEDLQEIRDVLWTIYLFLGIVLIAAVFQGMFYGLLLIWPIMALATSIVYIFLETTPNHLDYVTKLYTRVKADQYMKHLKEQEKEFAVIMIDLDDYKKINDTFGHLVGDQVIRVFANILRKVFADKGTMVSRFGGDEFIIVCEDVSKEYLEKQKESIKREIEKILDKLPIEVLKFSYGYSIDDKEKTIEDLMVEADDYMYQNKAENKNFKRRKTD